MMKRIVILAFGLSLACACRAAAQRSDEIAHVGVNRDTARTYKNLSPQRFISSMGISAVGLVVGGIAGGQVPPHDCGCDDPGLAEMIYGALIGATIGAAIGASYPNMRSVCSRNVRFGKSLVGSVIGASAGFILGGGFREDEAALLLTPAGAIGGSLIGLRECWRSHY